MVQDPTAKRMKIEPPAVPSDVAVIKSTSGGATVETIFQSTRAQGKALDELGFSWCKTDKVLLRLHIDATTTVVDLLAIDAVRATYKSGECVLSKRTYVNGFVFSALNEVCTEAGFTLRTGVGWIKAMDDTEWRALEEVAGTCSRANVERARMREEEALAVEQGMALTEKKMAERAAVWQERAKKDPTLERRTYQYGQLLKYMERTGNVSYGSDGAPNWPAPPAPGEAGIVSNATEHLASYPPRPRAHSKAYDVVGV